MSGVTGKCNKCGIVREIGSPSCLPCANNTLKHYREKNAAEGRLLCCLRCQGTRLMGYACRPCELEKRKLKGKTKITGARVCRDCSGTLDRGGRTRLCTACFVKVEADYVFENKEKIADYKRKYTQDNREHLRGIGKTWNVRNHDRFREIKRRSRYKNRAAMYEALGSHTQKEWLLVCKTQRYRCATCGSKDPLTRDHKIPVSMGGNDYILNIQGLCRACNSAKSTNIEQGTQFALFDNVSA